MDNFEEQFLEQLAKARARLEGKEAYDDDAIAKEFDPDAKPEDSDNVAAKKEAEAQKPKREAPVAKKAPADTQEIKKTESKVCAHQEKTTEKKRVSSEKLAVIWGVTSVAIAFILSCLGTFIESTSFAWQTFEAYMPFVGIVCGATSIICGALLIKDDKKGAVPIFLGLSAILVAILMSAL